MDVTRKKPGMFGYRIGRRAYWTGIGLLVALSVGLGFLLPSTTASSTTFVWVLLYAWRLHDFGRSGWWGAGLIAAMFVVGFGGLAIAAATTSRRSEAFLAIMAAVIVLVALMQIVFTIWVGAVRGDEGENRFGARTQTRLGRFTV